MDTVEFQEFSRMAAEISNGVAVDDNFLLRVWDGADQNLVRALNHILDSAPRYKASKNIGVGENDARRLTTSSSSSSRPPRDCEFARNQIGKTVKRTAKRPAATNESIQVLAEHVQKVGATASYFQYLLGNAGASLSALGGRSFSVDEIEAVADMFKIGPTSTKSTLLQHSSSKMETPWGLHVLRAKPEGFAQKRRNVKAKTGVAVSDDKRETVRKHMLEVLCRDASRAQHEELKQVVSEIEREIYTQLSPDLYTCHCRSVLSNLRHGGGEFRVQIMSGLLKPSDVPTLSADEMASDELRHARAQMRQLAMEEVQLDWDAKHADEMHDGLFTCAKCSSKKTTYQQLQIGHGLDEPMTTFVSCFGCGNRWKFDDVGASADAAG